MNTICVLILCVGGGPFSSAISQATPKESVLPAPPESAPDFAWQAKAVGAATIELPVLIPAAYTRTAPANYRAHAATKSVAVWCPSLPQSRHGYACGMQRAVEDLAGHLQAVHGVPLETLNEMGRENWLSYHADLHWCDETPARQAAFLNPQPAVAKPAARSGCGPNGCPTGAGYVRRGLFR